jgi:hypothetical protein
MSITNKLKNRLLNLFLKCVNNEKIQQSLNDTIKLSKQDLGVLLNEDNPYAHSTNSASHNQITSERDDIVFITSRFRSGSTLLWNIFRNIDGCTSYYEPFNERRWFDKKSRGEYVDSTHVGVDDYSSEYDGMEHLGQFYQEGWIREGLFMDANTWAPDMKSYICELIDKAKDRPVLQFNRIDFRLPWLKQNFPNAKFIHLHRHPRDQWYSFLTDKKSMTKDNIETTYIDGFYLNSWCDDLAKHFPFLDQRTTTHPYKRFYYLWKLSYLYGKKESDQSFSLQQLMQDTDNILQDLFTELNIDNKHLKQAASVIENQGIDKWKKFADNDWFEILEKECELELTAFIDSLKNDNQ